VGRAPCRACAGTWRETFAFLDKLEGVHVEVLKVKAHTSAEAVAEGLITLFDQKGNEWADLSARKGAGQHRIDEKGVEAYKAAWDKVQRVAEYIGDIVAYGVSRSLWDVPKQPQQAPKDSLVVLRYEHNIVEVPKGHRCTWCRKSAATAERLAALRASPCEAWVDRLKVDTGQRGHILRRSDDGTIWCSLCGAHSSSKLVALERDCPRRPTKWGRNCLDKLEAGLHPNTRQVIGASRRVLPIRTEDAATEWGAERPRE